MTVPSPRPGRPGRPAPPGPPARPRAALPRPWWERWGWGRAAEALPAVAALVITLVMSAVAGKPGDRPLWPGGAALIAVTTLALAWRRRHPVVLLAVATVVPPLYYPLGYPDGPIAFVFLVALFNAAVQCRLAVPLGAVIVVNAGFLTTSAVRGGGDGGDPDAVADARGVASLTLALLLTVGVGQYVRGRRYRVEEAERRAAEAERSREEEALRRAAQERLRIARELHDVLAHQISLINVQAGAALHRRDDPARAYAALEAIKAASRQTLRELRGVLGVLRQVDEAGAPGDGGGAGPVEPVPSLARVGELLERTSATGLRVVRAGDLTDDATDAGDGEGGGPLAAVPAPVGLAGYRIVQEALTNVVRHAGAREVTVEVRCTADAVIVRIDDDGSGPPTGADGAADGPARGNGLRGMRERAAAVGGELTAGPAPGGGFRVRARLPLDAPPGREAHDDEAGEQVADAKPRRAMWEDS
ncbi:sensor histidine kinase [Actinomadura opuntiae]|uniref:sensor histidine kinase n=1 Tax=Actinomadura sp. OS1-43 TaxID=604315 RepID=UPI00255ABCFF|nr:sensor histidine kinase [Actinomadura sp. OS1-43]MDL4821739.1 sensor histidine kinase [Actinomadura sp. OS1-43]